MYNKEYFSSRKSIRKYSDQPVSDTLIKNIIEKAMRAPTCGNMQLYTVIVTKDADRKRQLASYHFNQPATECDVILTVCADFNRFTKWCEISGANPGYSNFHSFIMALTDAVIFTQQIVTIAEMEGLGTCYLGTVNYTANEISNLLELPDLVVPVASISLGYPADDAPQTDRLPVEAILHSEKYVPYTESSIKALYNSKENDPENIKFIKENGKESLAQVFTDIRYPKDVNEKVSQSFSELLKKKGFL